MSFVIVLAALAFLMFAAYRGYSVILVAPIAALGAVLLTEPAAVAPEPTAAALILCALLPVFGRRRQRA